jgi:hypothetical protein
MATRAVSKTANPGSNPGSPASRRRRIFAPGVLAGLLRPRGKPVPIAARVGFDAGDGADAPHRAAGGCAA